MNAISIPSHLQCSENSQPKEVFPESSFLSSQWFYRYVSTGLRKNNELTGVNIPFPQEVSVNWSYLIEEDECWIYSKDKNEVERSLLRFGCHACRDCMAKATQTYPEYGAMSVHIQHDPETGEEQGTLENYSHCLLLLFKGSQRAEEGKKPPRPLSKVFRQEMAKVSLVKKDRDNPWLATDPNPFAQEN